MITNAFVFVGVLSLFARFLPRQFLIQGFEFLHSTNRQANKQASKQTNKLHTQSTVKQPTQSQSTNPQNNQTNKQVNEDMIAAAGVS
jgi:hypothetical protein